MVGEAVDEIVRKAKPPVQLHASAGPVISFLFYLSHGSEALDNYLVVGPRAAKPATRDGPVASDQVHDTLFAPVFVRMTSY